MSEGGPNGFFFCKTNRDRSVGCRIHSPAEVRGFRSRPNDVFIGTGGADDGGEHADETGGRLHVRLSQGVLRLGKMN